MTPFPTDTHTHTHKLKNSCIIQPHKRIGLLCWNDAQSLECIARSSVSKTQHVLILAIPYKAHTKCAMYTLFHVHLPLIGTGSHTFISTFECTCNNMQTDVLHTCMYMYMHI